jgi:hypothetical protein
MIPRLWGMMLFDLQVGWAVAAENTHKSTMERRASQRN